MDLLGDTMQSCVGQMPFWSCDKLGTLQPTIQSSHTSQKCHASPVSSNALSGSPVIADAWLESKDSNTMDTYGTGTRQNYTESECDSTFCMQSDCVHAKCFMTCSEYCTLVTPRTTEHRARCQPNDLLRATQLSPTLFCNTYIQ